MGRPPPSRNTARWRASSVRSANSKIACGQRAPAFALFIACLGHRPVGDAGPAYSSLGKSLVESFGSLHAGSRGEIGRAPSELQSLMRNSDAVFCLNKKRNKTESFT